MSRLCRIANRHAFKSVAKTARENIGYQGDESELKDVLSQQITISSEELKLRAVVRFWKDFV